MQTREMTANASRLMVEQMVASGVKYVFNNSGSREALFFNELHSRSDIHGVLGLHEGAVTAMAGGYTQANLAPGVMVVHLGAGLAQAMGQLINIWTGSLPVVVITFAGDTGSFAGKISLDVSHNAGPTAIAAPMMKANWTVIEPEGLPAALERALRVAMTPPVGPVHLAVYDRLLGPTEYTANIIDGQLPEIHAGYPSDADIDAVARALRDAKRPLMYVGDGVWKSGAIAEVTALAERFGVPVVGDPRAVSIKHPLHAGGRRLEQAPDIDPDLILCIGVTHNGAGNASDYTAFFDVERTIAIGADAENLENIPGLDLAVLADEKRAARALLDATDGSADNLSDRRSRAREEVAALRAQRRDAAWRVPAEQGKVRAVALGDALDRALESRGGGLVTIEQFAVAQDILANNDDAGRNQYIRPAGGSEGYGVGMAIGAKLGAPDTPVVGLVGDGSLYYSDHALWTAASHGVPVLYVISNNGAYGIVASSFANANANMRETGEYRGVVLDGIDPVKLAEGFGVEAMDATDEANISDAIEHGLGVVEREKRPFLLNVHLPLGLPEGGKPGEIYNMSAELG
ncbi:MAG: thiamine pyrophosphate-binding protein [Chloroflexota bacterium]|nr:thiamine pyrophosphate-binding protein [Chloroflexota bacterium]MDE2960579.1 thiamine pyrophosphate-binding protein [Chloroflexota bacterium]